jgi:hypothetical protein
MMMTMKSMLRTLWIAVKDRLDCIVEAIDRWIDPCEIDCDFDYLEDETPIHVLGLTFERARERDFFGTAWWNEAHAIELLQWNDGKWAATAFAYAEGEETEVECAEGDEAEDALGRIYRVAWRLKPRKGRGHG